MAPTKRKTTTAAAQAASAPAPPKMAPRMTIHGKKRNKRATAATAKRRTAAAKALGIAVANSANTPIAPPLAPTLQPISPPPPPPSPPTPLLGGGSVQPTIIDDEIALEIFGELGVKPDDYFLNSGKLLAWALPPDDPAFIPIHDYIGRGQLHGFGVKVLSILRIIPKADSLESAASSAPLDFSDDPTTQGQLRMMLWHGTRRCNLRAILENGLKLPTSHGQMFGSGIYFADRVSKSCQYCDNAHVVGGDAYLLLCDVLLGNMYNAYQAMPHLTGPPPTTGEGSVPFNSVKGCGLNVPDYQWDQFIDGCIWPLGPTVQNRDILRDRSINACLKFNEYIVYDAKRVQPKYMVKVEFTRMPVHEQLY